MEGGLKAAALAAITVAAVAAAAYLLPDSFELIRSLGSFLCLDCIGAG